MNTLLRLFALVLLLTDPLSAVAHGYWLELEGSHAAAEPATVKLFYGDYPDGERMTGKALDKMKDIKVYVQGAGGEKQQIGMTQTDSFWVGTFIPATSAVYEITGINDEREVQDWTKHNLGITRPIQYLKAYYTTGTPGTGAAASLPLDVVLKGGAGGRYEIAVKQAGRVLPAQKMTLSAFGADVTKLTTDAAGLAVVTLTSPGLYILSIDWIDNTPGAFRGKSYETVRHRLDYSIYHP